MSDDVSLLGPAEIRRLAADLDVLPTKRHGQNFVIDPNTVRRIVSVAGVQPGEQVLEVGPGLGSLTLALLERGARVTAVEIDERLAAELPNTVAAHVAPGQDSSLAVLAGDAMQVSVTNEPTALVANLPYNVAVPILLHLWQSVASLQRATVMVQLEVAERLVAEPGSRVYGVPSAKLAWWCEAAISGRIGRRVFWPEPRVDSALVSMTRREPPSLSTATRSAVFELVNAAFSQRRKMIRSALAPLAGGRLEQACAAAGVDPTSRAERLDIGAYARLADALAESAESPGSP